jgi:hypothetical protein
MNSKLHFKSAPSLVRGEATATDASYKTTAPRMKQAGFEAVNEAIRIVSPEGFRIYELTTIGKGVEVSHAHIYFQTGAVGRVPWPGVIMRDAVIRLNSAVLTYNM